MQPGNGRGYVRHLDYSRGIEVSAHPKSSSPKGRKLTAILYLNKEWEGGQLRVHVPKDSALPSQSFSANSTDYRSVLEMPDANRHFDIDPQYGRLVIFRR